MDRRAKGRSTIRLGLTWLLTGTLASSLLSGFCGCATRKQPKPAIGVYRLTRCAQNGDHWVCDCKVWHEAVNARTGERIMECY
jgi:hypothetical protein